MSKITLRILRKMEFEELYFKLLLKKELTGEEKVKLLKISLVFLNSEKEEMRKLGYRIISFYSITTKDFKPLYDVSLNLGYIPVARLISEKYLEMNNDSFFTNFQLANLETYKSGNIYLTEAQKKLNLEFLESSSQAAIAVVAPTSYGKSDLIINSINFNEKSCIIVPTKALLAQTKKRILESDRYNGQKIITHHEMYSEQDNSFISVLTQERLIKLLQSYPDLSIDKAYIDEAHNLLSDDNRDRLLASSILFLTKRNPSVKLRFFTPFLVDVDNLKTDYTEYEVEGIKISEYIKSERLYLCDFRKDKTFYLYDQFLDGFSDIEEKSYNTDIDLIKTEGANKNIIYLNRPVNIEKFVKKLISKLDDIDTSSFDNEINDIKEYLDENYTMIKCLKKGVVYHHGSVPDNIKLFIENLYSKHPEIKYILTTSTLLEGVNIPAEKIFLASIKKGLGHLSQSQFKNLIGRACRFREIFDEDNQNIEMLLPEIYVLGIEDYIGLRPNLKGFLRDRMRADKADKDESKNVLLENSKLDDSKEEEKEKFEEFLENIEPEITGKEDITYAQTEFGKSCFKNNVFEFDVLEHEVTQQGIVDVLVQSGEVAQNAEEVIEFVYKIFLKIVEEKDKYKNVLRLRDESGAREFYSKLFDWRMANLPYKQMIARFVSFWNYKISSGQSTFVFVYNWGDEKRDGKFDHWVDVSTKNESELVNLAIVRVKEEQDFIENYLFKYVEVLNDLNLLDPSVYKKLKFGTSDPKKIVMIKSGFSLALSNLLLSNYSSRVTVDLPNEKVSVEKEVIDDMVENNENSILVFESKLNIRTR